MELTFSQLGSIALLIAVGAVAIALAEFIPGFAEPAFAAGEGIIGQGTPEIGQFTVDYDYVNGKIDYSFSLKEKIGTIGLRTTNADKIRSIEVRMLSYDSKDIPVSFTAATEDTQIGPAINNMDDLRDEKYYQRRDDAFVTKPLTPGQYKFFVKIYTKDGTVIETPAAETWLRFFDEPYLETFDGTIAGCTDCNVLEKKQLPFSRGIGTTATGLKVEGEWYSCGVAWTNAARVAAGSAVGDERARQDVVTEDNSKRMRASFDGWTPEQIDAFSKETNQFWMLYDACNKLFKTQGDERFKLLRQEGGIPIMEGLSEFPLFTADEITTFAENTANRIMENSAKTKQKLIDNGFRAEGDFNRKDDIKKDAYAALAGALPGIGDITIKEQDDSMALKWVVIGSNHIGPMSLSYCWSDRAVDPGFATEPNGQRVNGAGLYECSDSIPVPPISDSVVATHDLPDGKGKAGLYNVRISAPGAGITEKKVGYYSNWYLERYRGTYGYPEKANDEKKDKEVITVRVELYKDALCGDKCGEVEEMRKVFYLKVQASIPETQMYLKLRINALNAWKRTNAQSECTFGGNLIEPNVKEWALLNCSPDEVDALYQQLLQEMFGLHGEEFYSCTRIIDGSTEQQFNLANSRVRNEPVCKAREDRQSLVTCEKDCDVFEKKRTVFLRQGERLLDGRNPEVRVRYDVWQEYSTSVNPQTTCVYKETKIVGNLPAYGELVDCSVGDVDFLYHALLKEVYGNELGDKYYACEESKPASVKWDVTNEQVCKAKVELEKNLKEQLHWINIDEAQT